MQLNETQRKEIHNLIEIGKHKEYKKFNTIVAKAVKEWKNGLKTDEQAYNKIIKKVTKNEHLLARRYSELNDLKALRTLAEIFVEDIITMEDFMKMDPLVKKEIYTIAGIKDNL